MSKSISITELLRRHRIGLKNAIDKLSISELTPEEHRDLKQILASTEREIVRAKNLIGSVR